MQHHVALSAMTVARRSTPRDEWTFTGQRIRRRSRLIWRRAARPAQWSPALDRGHEETMAAAMLRVHHSS